METKMDLLKGTTILSNLDDEELKIIAEYSDFEEYSKGKIIFEKGTDSQCFFIVERGEISIFRQLHSEDDEAIACFISGEIFGEFDLFEDDPRTAYAVANEDSSLLVFPKPGEQFVQIYKNHPHVFAKIYHTLITINAGRTRRINKLVSEKTQWIEELKKKMLFDKLTGLYNRSYVEDELYNNYAHLGDDFTILVIKPDNFKVINDTFGHEAGDKALTSISDTVKSLLKKDDIPVRFRGNEFVIFLPNAHIKEATIRAENFLSVLNNLDIGNIIEGKSMTLTFSIGIAKYPDHASNCEELVQKAFAKLFEQREAGGNGIRIASEDEDGFINFLKSIDIFSSLYLSELNSIAKHLHPITVEKNEAICKEGDEGNELYIIESGKTAILIKVQDGTNKELAELSSGDFFGEMAIFENSNRSATCIAKQESKILKMNKEDFFNIMKTTPTAAIKIMKNMLDITSSRVSATGNFLSEMVKWGNEASKRAVTDKLTGVYNRRYLESVLIEKFNIAKQEKKPISLIMADMDYFREVNEGYSLEIGDKYICEVAKVFKNTLRETDIIARYGGDEFTILLPDTTLEEGKRLAENIRLNVEKLDFLNQYKGPSITVSVSLGIANFPSNCENLKELRDFADKALYKAKNAGRNRVECAD